MTPAAHTAPRLPTPAGVWLAAVILLGGVSGFWWISTIGLGAPSHPWLSTGLGVAIVLGELRVRELARSIGDPDPWVVFGPALLALVGGAWTMAAACASIVGTHVLDRRPLRKLAFNVSLRVVSIAAAGAAMAGTGGTWPPLDPASLESPTAMIAVLMAGILWWLVPWTCVGMMAGLAARIPLRYELTSGILAELRTVALFVVVSPVVLLTIAHQPLLLPLVALPIAAAISSANRLHLQRAEARTDALTGLPNRTGFLETLDETLRIGQPFGICIIDLNGFKPINDTHGHLVGDDVLRVLGERLQSTSQDETTVAGRLGGDEFAILWREDLGELGYVSRAQAVKALIAEPLHGQDRLLQVGASLGIASFPQHGTESSDLLSSADKAMYVAKSKGGSNIRLASSLQPLQQHAT